MKKHFLRTAYQIFCLKELSRAINWGQLSGGQLLGGYLSCGNYPPGNYSGANCLGAIFLEAIVFGQLSWGNCPWGQLSRGAIVWWAIIWGVIVQGEIVLKPFCRANNFLACGFFNIICSRCCVRIHDGGRTCSRNRKPEKPLDAISKIKKEKEGQYEEKIIQVCVEEFHLNKEEVLTSLKKAVDDRMLKIVNKNNENPYRIVQEKHLDDDCVIDSQIHETLESMM